MPKDFDKEDYLTLVTPQSKKYLFRRRNEEQSLSLCVSGKTDYLFKGSHFGITCQKPVVVQIFEESKSLHFQSLLVSSRFTFHSRNVTVEGNLNLIFYRKR